jgi:hypothetical protein
VTSVPGAYQDASLVWLGERSLTVLQLERLRQRAGREPFDFSI